MLQRVYKVGPLRAMRRACGATFRRPLITDQSVSYKKGMTPADKKFRRRADTRPDEVLDAALAVFVEKGFAATKVDDIARRAGISKGTVYLYFASKEALIEGIVRRAVSPIAEGAVAHMSAFEGDPRLPISMLLHRVAQRITEPANLAVPKLVMREALTFPAIAQMYRTSVLDAVVPALTGLLARGMAEGHFRPLDPELTVRSIIGPVIAHVLLSEVFGLRPADGLAMDRLIENHVAILFDGLSAPRKEKGP